MKEVTMITNIATEIMEYMYSGPKEEALQAWAAEVGYSPEDLIDHVLINTVITDDDGKPLGYTIDWPLAGQTVTGKNRFDALRKCFEEKLIWSLR